MVIYKKIVGLIHREGKPVSLLLHLTVGKVNLSFVIEHFHAHQFNLLGIEIDVSDNVLIGPGVVVQVSAVLLFVPGLAEALLDAARFVIKFLVGVQQHD